MRRRPPTRPLILIALLLLAGAVVNVAMAWVASLWSSVAWEENRFVQEPFPAIAEAAEWPPCHTVIGSGGAGFDEALYFAGAERDDGSVEQWYLKVRRAGWPRRSLRLYYGGSVANVQNQPGAPAARRVVNIEQPRFVRTSRLRIRNPSAGGGRLDLPIEPIPTGFAINTLFYTAILALPLSVFPIRRRLRARRGRCPKCGYDLAGLAGAEPGAEGAGPCPECGAAR